MLILKLLQIIPAFNLRTKPLLLTTEVLNLLSLLLLALAINQLLGKILIRFVVLTNNRSPVTHQDTLLISFSIKMISDHQLATLKVNQCLWDQQQGSRFIPMVLALGVDRIHYGKIIRSLINKHLWQGQEVLSLLKLRNNIVMHILDLEQLIKFSLMTSLLSKLCHMHTILG